MRELNHAILGLEDWNKEATCDFCPVLGVKAVCQIISRNKVTEKLVAGNCACEDCRDRLEELPRCERCGRLETRVRFANGKYLCACVRYNENLEEKELPVLPHERSQFARHEERISELQNELVDAKVEIDTHLEALEVSEEWGKRQKQELLDRIKELEEENKRLKELTSHEAFDKLNAKEEEISELKTQLEKLVSQQTAKVEVPLKNGSIKHFFKLGGKK
jgi:hypothetical protein